MPDPEPQKPRSAVGAARGRASLSVVRDRPPRKRRFTVPLRTLMVFGFGALVALSVGGVLVMSVYVNLTTTLTLLNRQAIALIDDMERSLQADATEAEDVVAALVELHAQGILSASEPANRSSAIKALLLSDRVVEMIVIVDRAGIRSGFARGQGANLIDLSAGNRQHGNRAPGASAAPAGSADRPPRDGEGGQHPPAPSATGRGPQSELDVSRLPAELWEASAPVWLEPMVLRSALFHAVGQPLSDPSDMDSAVIALVGGRSFNRSVSAIGADNETTAFVLDSQGNVIAHSGKPREFRRTASIDPAAFPDPAVNAFAAASAEGRYPDTIGGNDDVSVGTAETDDASYAFITKKITALSNEPYTLGAYFNAADIRGEVRRVFRAAAIGLAALAIAVVLAIFFGNYLSRPLQRIARAATDFASLELDGYEPLPRSRVREVDNEARAMNAMHTALSQFSRYVPRELVRRLMESGADAGRSVEREITVLFTDVAGFTAMSEDMSARDTVGVLNEHFDLLCTAIVSNRGTVDKFMGDGLMAFWGAPLADDDHATHALAAAEAIVAAMQEFNQARMAAGVPSVRLRVGIHTGRAVVGNIGGADRQNYTVVGDVVNVASRIEQLGKELAADDDIVIMASGDTADAANGDARLEPAGSRVLRGRARPVRLFRLATSAHAGAQEQPRALSVNLP